MYDDSKLQGSVQSKFDDGDKHVINKPYQQPTDWALKHHCRLVWHQFLCLLFYIKTDVAHKASSANKWTLLHQINQEHVNSNT